MKEWKLAISICLLVMIIVGGVFLSVKSPPENKLRLNVQDFFFWSERINAIMKAQDVDITWIVLSGEEFVRRVEEKLNEGDFVVWSRFAWGLGKDFTNYSIIRSVHYVGEDNSNIMWYFEETTIPILQESGSYFLKTETFTVYYARGVIPQK